jgi:DNA mismatch repair protein MutS
VRFHSILFDRPENSVDVDEREEPSFFADLNLDQVVESMTAGREEYDLKPFFYAPLHDAAAVQYRHEILRDLEKKAVLDSVGAFAEKMRPTGSASVPNGEELREADKRPALVPMPSPRGE